VASNISSPGPEYETHVYSVHGILEGGCMWKTCFANISAHNLHKPFQRKMYCIFSVITSVQHMIYADDDPLLGEKTHKKYRSSVRS